MSASKTQFPIIKWAQRKDRLFITISVVHSKKPIVDLTDGKKIKYQGTDGTNNYAFELELYDEIVKEESKYTLESRNIFLNLKKKTSGPYWPRLIKDEKKYHWIEVDWVYFSEEDEEDVATQPIKPGQDFDDMPDMGEMDEDDEHEHTHEHIHEHNHEHNHDHEHEHNHDHEHDHDHDDKGEKKEDKKEEEKKEQKEEPKKEENKINAEQKEEIKKE